VCGIFGYLTSSPFAEGEEVLRAGLSALRHRGPDDEATVVVREDAVTCGFAFTRLAIVDLSLLGRQPMATEDGRFTLVFNGEIYNQADLRNELVANGVVFRGRSDSEVLLRAFALWGKAVVPRLRGMFAFAIYDGRERALFLVRDQIGIKPLYFAITPSRLAFSSEIRALVAAGLVGKNISHRAIASYLSTGSVAEPDTILEGVAPLAPATILEYRNGHARRSTYWEIPLATLRTTDPRAVVEELRPMLAESIRLRLIADVPVGVFLSGGVDSSIIAEVATRSASMPLRTFTVTFDDRASSEANDAGEVARRIGARHEEVCLKADEVASWVSLAVDALDQPSVDGFNTYVVSRAARKAGLKVALSGLGGDEVFAGYAGFSRFGPLLAAGRMAQKVPGLSSALLRRSALFERAPQRARKLLEVLAAGGSVERAYLGMRSLFGAVQLNDLCSRDVAVERASLPVRIPERLEPLLGSGGMDAANAYSALEISNYLTNTLLRDADVMSMRHALEVRVPFVDHLLIERVMSLPADMKIKYGQNKPLLIAAGNGSSRLLRRTKRGFGLPFGPWLKGPLRAWAEEILLGPAARKSPFLHAEAVAKYWRMFLENESSVGVTRIFGLVILLAYLQRNETVL